MTLSQFSPLILRAFSGVVTRLIAAKISAVPGPGGIATQQPIQVRQVMDQAPSDVAEMEAFLQQVGGER